MPIIKYGNHIIEVRLDPKTGEETVFYDGQVVSSKISVEGATHKFSVNEEGKDITYEVKIGTRGLEGLKGIFYGLPAYLKLMSLETASKYIPHSKPDFLLAVVHFHL
ncbi:hypothetical protein KEJ18_07160 [Candidatus Bathyarchaeota archaeon]|nr:hypothetical protein [Candidatus Bathyarchaeota archaeon]